MTAIMRRTVRGSAATLGALAVVAGTAACGGLIPGGDEEGEAPPPASEEQPEEDAGSEDEGATEDEGAAEDGDAAESDPGSAEDEPADTEDPGAAEGEGDDAAAGGEDAAGEPLAEGDLTAVGDRYYEFLEAAAGGDGAAACGLITNPNTGQPLEGGTLDACAQGFENKAESQGIDPSIMDSLDRSMVEGVDNGDGTAGVTMMGQDAGVTFVKADDDTWYIDGGEFL